MSVSSGVAVGEADRLVLSVTAPALVERILAGFVDELMTGDVVIKGIARVAGAKTKIAVAPTRPGVEPKGAFIGRRANRLRGRRTFSTGASGTSGWRSSSSPATAPPIW